LNKIKIRRILVRAHPRNAMPIATVRAPFVNVNVPRTTFGFEAVLVYCPLPRNAMPIATVRAPCLVVTQPKLVRACWGLS